MSGRLGRAALPAAAYLNLYTVPAAKVATATLHFFNTTATELTVEISIRTGLPGNGPAAGECFDKLTVPANATAGWNRVPLSAGEIVTVRASAAGIDAQVRGFEEYA